MMAVVYYYVPVEKANDVVECGMKLSEWKDREQETPWSSGTRPCICTLLHPEDDKRSRDISYQCIKINIPAEDCIVADRDLYRLSRKYPDIRKKYVDTMVPLNRYMFGTFRNPECLIFTTILSEQISFYGRGLEDPILYESSESLYVHNILERFKDKCSDINQVMLYCFLSAQLKNNLVEGLYDNSNGLAFFIDKESDRYITVPVPDLKKYNFGVI